MDVLMGDDMIWGWCDMSLDEHVYTEWELGIKRKQKKYHL
jgi:hypothetical protein